MAPKYGLRPLRLLPWTQILLLLALSALGLADGDDFVGYYVNAATATCPQVFSDISKFEPGCTGVSEDFSVKVDATSCIGIDFVFNGWYTTHGQSGAFRNHMAICVGKDGACATYTIYDKSPDIGDRETTVMCAGNAGLPVEARTLYRTLPEQTTDTEPSSTDSSKQSSDDDDDTDGGSNNSGIIAGAVVGSIAGMSLIIAAFFLGRRRARKAATLQVEEHNRTTGKPELSGEGASGAIWGTIQGAFGIPRNGQPSPGLAELDGQRGTHISELDRTEGGRPQELPGNGPLVSELATYPGLLKGVGTSEGVTPMPNTPRREDE